MRARRYSSWNTRRLGGVTVSVRPRPKTPYTILQVDNLIDNGRGMRTATLKNALPNFLEIDLNPPGAREKINVRLPHKISDLNCTYIGRGFGIVADVTESLQAVTGNAKLAAIVPDVIRPGDFVLFKHTKSGMRFAGLLRAVPKSGMQTQQRTQTILD